MIEKNKYSIPLPCVGLFFFFSFLNQPCYLGLDSLKSINREVASLKMLLDIQITDLKCA